MMKKCEACEINMAKAKLVICSKIKYYLCLNCLLNFVTVSLSKDNFKNLIKNGHSVDEFYLHDDFYDAETGEALQSKIIE